METMVISYSLTGNNEALAKSLSVEFAARHVTLTEPKARTTGNIVLDLLLNRTPTVHPIAVSVENVDLVLFVGPVWMGQVATPLRSYIDGLKTSLGRYAFISICGGALGPNLKLAGELKRRSGKEPIAVIDLHIADLLPPDPKPTMKVTSAYRLRDTEIPGLTATVAKALGAAIHHRLDGARAEE